MNIELLGKYLSEINRDFIKYSEDILNKSNLTLVMWRCLLIINIKNKVNLNDIAKEINVDKAHITRTIKKLETENYILREKDENDSRSYNLKLTKEGTKTLNTVKKDLKPWYENFFKDFTDGEIETLFILLNKGRSNL